MLNLEDSIWVITRTMEANKLLVIYSLGIEADYLQPGKNLKTKIQLSFLKDQELKLCMGKSYQKD